MWRVSILSRRCAPCEEDVECEDDVVCEVDVECEADVEVIRVVGVTGLGLAVLVDG